MVAKIFEILSGINKRSYITKSAQVETVEKIVDDVMNGNINPVEAYVVLDYLKKVTDEAIKEIKATTLEYMNKEGYTTAFNVKLSVQERKDYAYEEDRDWAEQEKKMSIYKAAMSAREKFLKDLVNKALTAGKEPPISFTTSMAIVPKPESNT